MKKFFLLFALMGLVSVGVNAQTCTKSKTACTKSAKTVKADKASNAYLVAASAAAKHDESVEERVCAKSGSVSFVRKSVCSTSGKVSYQDVEYCTKSKKFVNMSPSEGKKASCTKSAKSCTKEAKGASATKVSNKTASANKKSCSSKKTACCAKKKATGTTSAANAKLVKNEK